MPTGWRTGPKLSEALSAATRQRSKADLLAACEAEGVPAGPINDMAEVFADPQVQARGMKLDLGPHRACARPSSSTANAAPPTVRPRCWARAIARRHTARREGAPLRSRA
jgi:crotonobetainyl-CoA:carnitine CoA-transferase CaiB-like acyl-CoA transferase